jgi:membrane protein YdbS with pleckstrin-like domain
MKIWVTWSIGAFLYLLTTSVTWYFQHTRSSYFVESLCILVSYISLWTIYLICREKNHIIEG